MAPVQSYLHVLVSLTARGPAGVLQPGVVVVLQVFDWRHLLPALAAPAPALGHLLPLGQSVVAGTAGGESHTEGGLHLHCSCLSPQAGVANTGHLARRQGY